jgi:hypothetical protein
MYQCEDRNEENEKANISSASEDEDEEEYFSASSSNADEAEYFSASSSNADADEEFKDVQPPVVEPPPVVMPPLPVVPYVPPIYYQRTMHENMLNVNYWKILLSTLSLYEYPSDRKFGPKIWSQETKYRLLARYQWNHRRCQRILFLNRRCQLINTMIPT